MMFQSVATAFILVLTLSASDGHGALESCPRTIGSPKVFSEPWPQADTWFGTEALAVILPKNGVWPTTKPGHQTAFPMTGVRSVTWLSNLTRDKE